MEFTYEDGRYYHNDENGKTIAEVTFDAYDDNHLLIINRTFVDPVLRGQGIAKKLMQMMIIRAQVTGSKIVPKCSYAKKFFDLNYDDFKEFLMADYQKD